ncbi:unnamed protein product [Coregonus sp. 'balchen']|nr:unnamed protein product [Coregonus sp. 'balchen']
MCDDVEEVEEEEEEEEPWPCDAGDSGRQDSRTTPLHPPTGPPGSNLDETERKEEELEGNHTGKKIELERRGEMGDNHTGERTDQGLKIDLSLQTMPLILRRGQPGQPMTFDLSDMNTSVTFMNLSFSSRLEISVFRRRFFPDRVNLNTGNSHTLLCSPTPPPHAVVTSLFYIHFTDMTTSVTFMNLSFSSRLEISVSRSRHSSSDRVNLDTGNSHTLLCSPTPPPHAVVTSLFYIHFTDMNTSVTFMNLSSSGLEISVSRRRFSPDRVDLDTGNSHTLLCSPTPPPHAVVTSLFYIHSDMNTSVTFMNLSSSRLEISVFRRRFFPDRFLHIHSEGWLWLYQVEVILHFSNRPLTCDLSCPELPAEVNHNNSLDEPKEEKDLERRGDNHTGERTDRGLGGNKGRLEISVFRRRFFPDRVNLNTGNSHTLLCSPTPPPHAVVTSLVYIHFTAPPANHSTLPGRGFIRNHRMALETRLGRLQPILSHLEYHKALNAEEREEVVSKSTKTQQNQALLDMVVRKGAHAQKHFYQVLKEVDPYLVEDLEEQTV